LIVVSSVTLICLLSACSLEPQTQASIVSALPNLEYPIDLTSTGKAMLKNGVFEEPSAPGSASKTVVTLDKFVAEGDLNGDSTKDVAATLIATGGGSGTFIYLAAVLNQNSTAKPVATVAIGDRITVKSLGIQSGEIVIVLLTRGPNDPTATPPTIEATRKYKLQGDKLAEIK
jgi:hypothetical protein